MKATPGGRRPFVRGLGAPTLLLLALLAINGAAVWSIVSTRREATAIARDELELQTFAQARTVEAVLATLRGDLIFLSQAPPLSRAIEILERRDPFTRRQGRLDLEGTLYLFMESHPPLQRLSLLGRDGRPLLAIGRREGAPVLVSREEIDAGPEDADRLACSIWPLGSGSGTGTVEAWVAPEALLEIAAPTLRERLELVPGDAPPAAEGADEGAFVVRQPVSAERWMPPIRWTLVRRENESRLLASVDVLAQRFRTTLALNLLVMSLALFLGGLAYRQARRAERLEAENRHQAQVRELEQRVRHSDRLASVGRLAAGIAHEINNPLAGMSNYLTLLREDLQRGRVPEAAGLVDRVQEGLDRAAGIVRQVLAFADPGRSPREGIDLAAVLDRTVAFVRQNPDFRHLELVVEAKPRPLSLDGNPTTLGQLFLNLVLNACHAQPAAGRVDVRASIDTAAHAAVVAVEDRGPGLSEEALRSLFEPFHSTRESTGLGLAICHGIVGEHGGRIRGENRDGGGARFVVELPLGERTTT